VLALVCYDAPMLLLHLRFLAAIFIAMTAFGCAMPGESFTGILPPLTAGQTRLADELKRYVTVLAKEIGERNLDHPEALAKAADYIEQELQKTGLKVERQTYQVKGQASSNLSAEIKGKTDEIVLIGAHYDSVRGAPGANDNGSGIAALLALARRMAKDHPQRTLRLVAFVNEEPPYFQTADMGSVVNAKAAKERGDKITAMLSIETIGCYLDAPDSQHYPPPFNLVYPSTGNFIAFVGNTESAELVKRIVGKFRHDVRFPSEGAAVLGSIEGVGWSDHWSFWQQGYAALMVTDTAPFRYKWYHTAGDTPEKIDYERTARVVEGLEIVIRDLLSTP
jgi:Zn-dependent M28 family amino/carboxypeptidase